MITRTAQANPFPGLRPFQAFDSDHPFFGRDEQIDELLARLRRTRFLAIVGTSGSGKSSLVRAGLLPALYGGSMAGAGSRWRIAMFRPELDPIGNLARAVTSSHVLGTPDTQEAGDEALQRRREFEASMMEATLRGGSRGLVEAVLQANLHKNENLLVLVDQFEELFRFTDAARVETVSVDKPSDEAAAFVKLLLEVSADPEIRVYVALTMRSDYLGECARYRCLPEKINEALFLVPRMKREQLQLAIEGPVRVTGARISPTLVARLLNDVGDDPDQLPVLQHALMRTWDYWQSEGRPDLPIETRHYEKIGGLKEALSFHADDIFDRLSPKLQETVVCLFRCITLSDRGAQVSGVRRPTRFADARRIVNVESGDLIDAVEAFNAPGCSFLMPPRGDPFRANTVLDISHESLMRIWKNLQRWVQEEAECARIYRRLSEDADGGAGYWRDANLAVGLEWLEKNRPFINEAWAARYVP